MARRRRRPVHPAVLVIGILHLVGACFGLCLFTFHTGLQDLIREAERQRLQQDNPGVFVVFEDDLHPELKTVARVELWANVAFSGMLLAAGVGLLLRHGWARWLSIVYAVLSILFKIGDTVVYLGFAASGGGEHLDPDAEIGRFVLALFGLALGLAYAVAVLVVMFLPGVARSLRRQRIPTFLYEDEADLLDDDNDEEDHPRFGRRR
jgi:hypothetical protein